MNLKFEWDEEKDRMNREKHGISFETASYVFRDEYYIEMYDFEIALRKIVISQSGWSEICCLLSLQNAEKRSG